MFQYFNHDNRWPRVRAFGVERNPDGTLTLRRLPGPPRPLGCVPGQKADESRVAGIAPGPDGASYVSNPAAHCIYRIDPAVGSSAPLGCLGCGEKGSEVGRFNEPTGLTFQQCRGRLLVADRLNHRVQVIDPASGRVVAVYGQTWPFEPPRPSGADGGLNAPEQLACDRCGNIYVIDGPPPGGKGDARVVKLDPDGNVIPSFERSAVKALAKTLEIVEEPLKSEVRVRPRSVAVAPWSGSEPRDEAVYVLISLEPKSEKELYDPDPGPIGLMLVVLDTHGRALLPTPLVLFSLPTPAPRDRAAVSHVEVTPEGDRLRGFAVLGTMAFVGLAARTTPGCYLREPDRVWCFEFASAALGTGPVEPSWLPLYPGPVAALGVRGKPDDTCHPADLLVSAGPGRDISGLRHRGAYRTQGVFLAGPFTGYRGRATPWHRLRFDGELLPGTNARFFTLSRSNDRDGWWSKPPRPRLERLPAWYRLESYADSLDAVGFSAFSEVVPVTEPAEYRPLRPASATPVGIRDATPPGVWYAAPDSQLDFLTRNSGGTPKEPADQFWVLGLLAGDGTDSPRLTQAQLEHDEDGWLNDLPAVYQQDPRGRAFVRSLLAFLESVFEDVAGEIDRLPALFSPEAVAGRYGPTSHERGWLAGCIGLPAPVPDRPKSDVFMGGADALGRRGTPAGLRDLILLETGVRLHIDEPGLADVPWLLGDATDDGAVLAPVSPDGTALRPDRPGWAEILGEASLADPDRPATRLARDLAYHVVARGHEADLGRPEVLAAVEQALRRLVPAHSTYSLQTIAPRMRVGVQARLGIDAVVAPGEPVAPLTLGDPPGPDTQITPTPPTPAAVGTAHLGSDSTLR